MDDEKRFTKNIVELKILIETIRLYMQDTSVEFDIDKCAMLMMKNGKRDTTEWIGLPNQESTRTLGEKKITRIWEYWKRKPSNK